MAPEIPGCILWICSLKSLAERNPLSNKTDSRSSNLIPRALGRELDPGPGLPSRIKRPEVSKDKCKRALNRLYLMQLLLVALNPSGLSGRLQPPLPRERNDRHYYLSPEHWQCVVGGEVLPASSKNYRNLNFQREIEDTKGRSATTEGPQDPPPLRSPPAQTIPCIQSTGPGPGMWEPPQSPSVCKVVSYNIPHCQVLPCL